MDETRGAVLGEPSVGAATAPGFVVGCGDMARLDVRTDDTGGKGGGREG